MSLSISYIIKKYGDKTSSISSINEKEKSFTEIEDIGGCKSLTKLDVSKNKLTSFGGCINCYSLTYLNLSNNQIDSIPKEISLLSNLITLNISFNEIVNIDAIGVLSNLKSLIATGNKIKSTKALSKLSLLNTLILSKNEISDTTDIHKLRLLEKLSLSHNKLTEFKIGFGLSSLLELRLNENKLLVFSCASPKLKFLDIGNNPIVKKADLLSTLKSYRKLDNLNIKGCGELTDEEIKISCPKLTVLNNKKVSWREEYFSSFRKDTDTGKREGTTKKMPKQDKKAKKRTKQSVEDNEEKIEEYIQEEPKRAKIDEDEEDNLGKILKKKNRIRMIEQNNNITVQVAADKNVTGIKKIKRAGKEEHKGSFKDKSKEEKLRLLEQLHPF